MLDADAHGFSALLSERTVSPTTEIVQFPLAFCILPALLIVFLGPPLLSLLR